MIAITIRDVARRAQVSAATVSLVLNSSDSGLPISEATRARVRKAAAELGYHPNSYAQTLRTKKSRVIGILAFDIVDPYCAHVLRGAEDVIHAAGYYPMFGDLQNDEQKLHRYIGLFRERRAEGLLLLASSLQVEDQLIYGLHGQRMPLVVIGREVGDAEVPTVVTDSVNGAFLATEHLIELGHRQLAFILGPPKVIDSRQRWEGSQQALNKHGLRADPHRVVEETEVGWGPHAGYSSMRELLSREEAITAVVAFDDISAFGAIRAITEAGLRVPEDISVVGFDDIPAAAYYNPPLTTIQYSMVEMGRMGANLLFERIASRALPPGKVVPGCALVVRKSTAAPKVRG